MSVLGGLLLDPEKIKVIQPILKEDDFYRRDHQIIYAAIKAMSERKITADIVSTSEYLERHGKKEDTGGMAYLGEIISSTPGATNIETYANIVRDKAQKRTILKVLSECMSVAKSSEGSPEQILSEINERFLGLDLSDNSNIEMKGTEQLIKQVVDKIEEYVDLQGKIPGVSTGFESLDEKTLGLQDSDLVVLAGRPSMGKSAFGMHLCSTASRQSRKPVFVFSLEMLDTNLMIREVASLGRVQLNNIKRGDLSDSDYDSLLQAFETLKENKNIYICDKSNLSVEEIVAITRKTAMREGKPQMIMVDYLQFMAHTGTKDREDQEIQHMTKSLKGLAKEMNCPLVLLSQLNRGLENRQDKRPIMADLKGSGAIEQDADLIMFLYRDEVYNAETELSGITEVIIGKQREGELSSCFLRFDGSTMSYSEAKKISDTW